MTGHWGAKLDSQLLGNAREVSSPLTVKLAADDRAIACTTIPRIDSDSFQRGWEYLNRMRQLAPEPGMIELSDDISDRIRICTWIGERIDAINLELAHCLEACHQCFSPEERRNIEIFAAPLASRFGIDGLCNILLDPIVIFIDVGRVASQDWFSLVVHEYAHAHLKSPGHDRHFLAVLTHLCLGIGFVPPISSPTMNNETIHNQLRNWPHCTATSNSLDFWQGK